MLSRSTYRSRDHQKIQTLAWSPGLTLDVPGKHDGGHLSTTQAAKKAGSRAIESGKQWRYLSHSCRFVDVTGYLKWSDQMTTQAGVYKLFNSTYSTWDSLRSISAYGTSNRIDRKGEGLHRFTRPGRNFAVNLSINF